MSESTLKDQLLQFLVKGNFEEFNKLRPYGDLVLDLSEIDLNDMKISGFNLSNADLSGSDFSKSEITEVDFSHSNLSSVNFTRSTITDSNFMNVVLEGTLLNNASVLNSDFTEVDFNGVNLSGADFSGADLSLAKNLIQVVCDPETVWPDDEMLPEDFDVSEVMAFDGIDDDDDYAEEGY